MRQSDYGIKPVSIAGGTLKLKDEIDLSFDIVARVEPAGVRSTSHVSGDSRTDRRVPSRRDRTWPPWT